MDYQEEERSWPRSSGPGSEFSSSGEPIEVVESGGESVPPREDLEKLPKTVLLKIAIELDPDVVAEHYQEGWTKEDILRVIERHLKAALGRQPIEGWPLVQEVEIFESEVEVEKEEPGQETTPPLSPI